jgi:hypothetical protein
LPRKTGSIRYVYYRCIHYNKPTADAGGTGVSRIPILP